MSPPPRCYSWPAAVEFENARCLLAQLADAIAEVDIENRDDVADHLETRSIIASTLARPTDENAALTTFVERFGPEGLRSDTAGATWISDTCMIDRGADPVGAGATGASSAQSGAGSRLSVGDLSLDNISCSDRYYWGE